MTDLEWQVREASITGDELRRVLWRQWRIEYHEQSRAPWRMLAGELKSFRNRQSLAHEPVMVALVAVLNQMFARYSLPEVPNDLASFVHNQDQWAEVARPDPEDWYAHAANKIGITQREDWPEIDGMVRWITAARQEYLNQTERADLLLASTLCDICECANDPWVKLGPGDDIY